MQNSKIKKSALFLLVCGLLSGVTACGNTNSGSNGKNADTTKVDIRMYVNGSEVELKDAGGYIIDGKPYLPVDAVASALGQEAGWDENSNTVYVVSTGEEDIDVKETASRSEQESDNNKKSDNADQKAAESSEDSGAASSGLGVTKAAFDAIKTDMTYDEVVEIIGFEGELLSENSSQAMYEWSNGGIGAPNINIILRNGKVSQKSQWQLD